MPFDLRPTVLRAPTIPVPGPRVRRAARPFTGST